VAGKSPKAPIVIVHALADALAALQAARAAGCQIVLASAEGAGAFAGPLWFRALVEAAEEREGAALAGAVIDCGPYPGPVMESLELGFTRIRFTGARRLAKKLAAMADARGALLITSELKAFDTLDKSNPKNDLEAWLRRLS
jgi:hypothetical protein